MRISVRTLAARLDSMVRGEYRVRCSAVNPRASMEGVLDALRGLVERVVGGGAGERIRRLGPFTLIEGEEGEASLLVYGPRAEYRVVSLEGGSVAFVYSSAVLSLQPMGPEQAASISRLYLLAGLAAALLPRSEPGVLKLSGATSVEAELPPVSLQDLLSVLSELYSTCGSLECVSIEELAGRLLGASYEAVRDTINVFQEAARSIASGGEVGQPPVFSLTLRLGLDTRVTQPFDYRVLALGGESPRVSSLMLAPAPIVHAALLGSYLSALGAEPDEGLQDVLLLKAVESIIQEPPGYIGVVEEKLGLMLAGYHDCLSFHGLLVRLSGPLATRSTLVEEAGEQLLEEYRRMLVERLVERLRGVQVAR